MDQALLRRFKHACSMLRDLSKQTAHWERRLDDARRQIYSACTHEWVVDHGACGHKTERACRHCHMAPGTYPKFRREQ